MPHPWPHLHLPEHHRALGYLADLSILTDERPSDPSPEPYLPPSSPPPWDHTGKPPSVQNHKLGPLLSGMFPSSFFSGPSCRPAGFYRLATGTKGGERLPCLGLRPKGPVGWAVMADVTSQKFKPLNYTLNLMFKP
jgi:hypothetical protein